MKNYRIDILNPDQRYAPGRYYRDEAVARDRAQRLARSGRLTARVVRVDDGAALATYTPESAA